MADMLRARLAVVFGVQVSSKPNVSLSLFSGMGQERRTDESIAVAAKSETSEGAV